MNMAVSTNQLQKILEGLSYPVSKDKIIETAKSNGADEAMVSSLEKIPEREYTTVADIARQMGSMKW